MKRLLRRLGFSSEHGVVDNCEEVATPDISAMIDRSWSGRGGDREVSAHSGCKHRVAPQLATAELTAEQAAQLQLLRGTELLDTATSRPASPLVSPLPNVLMSAPESPACCSSTHATNPSASVGSCSAGCGPHSPSGHPTARLRRASSTSALVRQQAAASRDSASSIHRSCSAGAILKVKGLHAQHLAAEAAAAHAGNGGSEAGKAGAAAADDGEGPSAGREASELAQEAGLLAQLTVAGLLASADEGLLHSCASPTVSLLSVQLRSARDSMAMADGSQGGLSRRSALSLALSASNSREASARGGAFSNSGDSLSREPSARSGGHGRSREASARGGAFGVRGVWERGSEAGALRAAEAEAVAAASAQAGQSGSWVQRVKTFTLPQPPGMQCSDSMEDDLGLKDGEARYERARRRRVASASAGVQPQLQPGAAAAASRRLGSNRGPVDPLELNDALEAALAVSSVLVGDCELATAVAGCVPGGKAASGSGAPVGQPPAAAVAQRPAVAAARVSAGSRAEEDAGVGSQPCGLAFERAQSDMACSVPDRPALLTEAAEAASKPRGARSACATSPTASEASAELPLPPLPPLPLPLPPQPHGELSDEQAREWQQRFQQRWRRVRRRAFLQGLGLRALWRVSSPGEAHDPPALDLLINNYEAGGGGRRSGEPASCLVSRDPSLSTMLLGEVAEVT